MCCVVVCVCKHSKSCNFKKNKILSVIVLSNLKNISKIHFRKNKLFNTFKQIRLSVWTVWTKTTKEMDGVATPQKMRFSSCSIENLNIIWSLKMHRYNIRDFIHVLRFLHPISFKFWHYIFKILLFVLVGARRCWESRRGPFRMFEAIQHSRLYNGAWNFCAA